MKVFRGNGQPFVKKIKPGPKKRRAKTLEPYQIIQRTHHELLQEIQYKYPGLYNLSHKTGHKLLEKIAKIIFDRVKDIMGGHLGETIDECFKLSGRYRKLHPHYGDFPMIVSTLHGLQDASGAPHLQIQEQELLVQPINPYRINKGPPSNIKAATKQYTDRVVKAMTTHIQTLNTTPTQLDGEEDIARKRVRVEMKKMLPYLPNVMHQIIQKHFRSQQTLSHKISVVEQSMQKNFRPQETPLHRIRIYGEPFLPSMKVMSPFVSRYHGGASRVMRHSIMYNLLLFKITRAKYDELMAMDGHTINGATLVIRSDIPTYACSKEQRGEMAAALGAPRRATLVQAGTSDYEEDDQFDDEL